MKVRVQLTEEDYVSTWKGAVRFNRKFMVLLALVAINGIGMAIYNIVELSRGEAVDVTRWTIVILMVVMAWAFLVGAPNRMKKTFRELKLHERPYEVEMDNDGFRSTNELGYTVLKWSDVPKWRQARDMILVYQTATQCFLLPRHSFASDADFAAAAGILQSKVGAPA